MTTIPYRSISNYDSSLQLSILERKKSFEEDETFKFLSPVHTANIPIEKYASSLPKKIFKCDTASFIEKPIKNITNIGSKENLYLNDKIQKEELNHAQSTSNMLTMTLKPQEIVEQSQSSLSTFNKFECLLTSSQKKISQFGASTFEFEYPNEPDAREILTEENALKLLKKLFYENNYLFWGVDETTIKNVLPYIFLKKFKAKTTILQEGETAVNFFIIQSGIVAKSKSNKVVKYIEKGKMFGEKSLFDQMKRTSSYIAESNCLLWGINIATFFRLLKAVNHENYNQNRLFLNKISILKVVENQLKDQIALNLSEQKFQRSEVILEKGSVCACCFMIKKGEIVIRGSKNNQEKVLKSGDYIGDWSLNSFFLPSTLEASSKEEVVLLVISNKKMRGILGDNLYSLNWKNLSRIAFSQSLYFSKLPNETIECLIDNLEINCYEKNQTIIKKGGEVNSIFITLDGNIRKSSITGKNEIVSEDCALFGENYLRRRSFLKSDESIVMEDSGIIGEISHTNIERIIGVKLNDFFQIKNNNHLEDITLASSITSIDKSLLQKPKCIDKNDIEVLKMAGDGQFGLVFLIRLNKEHYALKMCSKSYIVSRRFELYLINEKKIQSSLGEFPFLIKFYQSFQDENLVYFLMDYVNGSDLASIFYDGNKLFSSVAARFYVAQLILTIEYLHSKKIIHRDIKLNNIIVDHYGYIKLIDFGIAKLLHGNNRTFTIVGTPHYMAPEIILGKGYDYSVDFWAIGVCLFEVLFGILPFGNDTEDPLEVYSHIISSKLPQIDKRTLSRLTVGTIDFINRMLNKDPTKRFGVKNYEEIKKHEWFSNFDWEGLFEKKLPTYHPQKEEKFENMTGKKLNEYLEMEQIKSYLKKEENKLSNIRNWDECF